MTYSYNLGGALIEQQYPNGQKACQHFILAIE
jgi:hypothetical protein